MIILWKTLVRTQPALGVATEPYAHGSNSRALRSPTAHGWKATGIGRGDSYDTLLLSLPVCGPKIWIPGGLFGA